jgi:Right handed beta helix region
VLRRHRGLGLATSVSALLCGALLAVFSASPARAATYSATSDSELAQIAPQSGDKVVLHGVFNHPLVPVSGVTYVGDARFPEIDLRSVHDVTVDGLEVSGPAQCVLGSAYGTGSQRITLRNLRLHDCGDAGILAANPLDASWAIERSDIARTQNCGIFFRGSGFVVRENRVTNTGLSPTIPYPLHGIYAKGPDPTIEDNTIVGFQTAGITIRYENSRVIDNTIAGGAEGISFWEESATAGTTVLSHNHISNVRLRLVIQPGVPERFVITP